MSTSSSWKGILALRAIEAPVVLISGTTDADISLTAVHAADNGTLKRQQVCESCEGLVDADDTVKAFKAGDQLIPLSKADIDSLAPASRKRMTIEATVGLDRIPRPYFVEMYHVRPDGEAAIAAYTLLYHALFDTNLVGLGKVSFRGRERLAAIAAGTTGLVLFVLRFAKEIRHLPLVDVASGLAQITPDHVASAVEILRAMHSSEFYPEHYCDEYSKNLLELVESRGGTQAAPVSIDEALAASLPAAATKRVGGRSRARAGK